MGSLLSISVVSYNSTPWLESFFDSLLQQGCALNGIELLWLDNGSTDATLAAVEALRARHSQKFARFELAHGPNIGFGSGHNRNLQQAQGDFFLVTNVDLRFESDTLQQLLAVAQSDAADVAAWECRQKPYEHPKLYHPASGETEWCSCACALFRTHALRAVAGFEPRLFLYGEDVELSYRLRAHGYRLRYVPRAVVWHYTYEHAAELKPAQFLGSTLAHVLLRCRYGNWREALVGLLMYASLFFLPAGFPGQRSKLLRNAFRLLFLMPHFLLTRMHRTGAFGFRGWDYSVAREGAFYLSPETPPAGSDPALAQPLVSVLVRTMPGRAGKLREALASIAAQTYPRVELVVVEDGGNSAQALVDEWRGSGRFSAVLYFPLNKVGRCAAGNAALAAATGDLLGFLDDDDLLFADHLEVLVQAWQAQPTLGAVYGLAWQVRTHIISHEPWQYRDIEHSLLYRQNFDRAIMWHHNYLPIQTVLFQRSLYQRWGGFDLELENLEDWNLWVRYSLHDDFAMVYKVTSLYRVPAQAEQAAQRQRTLDDHYARALEKHGQLAVQLTPTQFLSMAQTLHRSLNLLSIEKSSLQSWLLRLPRAAIFYHLARKLWYRLQRRKHA